MGTEIGEGNGPSWRPMSVTPELDSSVPLEPLAEGADWPLEGSSTRVGVSRRRRLANATTSPLYLVEQLAELMPPGGIDGCKKRHSPLKVGVEVNLVASILAIGSKANAVCE